MPFDLLCKIKLFIFIPSGKFEIVVQNHKGGVMQFHPAFDDEGQGVAILNPASMSWESQAVSLVPIQALRRILTHKCDLKTLTNFSGI
jgi:hypothetical protein